MHRKKQTVVAAAALLLASACAESPTATVESGPLVAMSAVGPVVGSASGSGHAPCTPVFTGCDTTDPTAGLRTFSFNASLHADGSVKGQVQMKNRATDQQVHLAVRCLRFIAPNRAWVLGQVTRSVNSAAVGSMLAFGVVDNGEGAGAVPDRITVNIPPGFGPFQSALICEGGNDPFLGFVLNALSFEIAEGNVQVRAPS